MRVVHVNTTAQSGGAARAAFRLHQGLHHTTDVASTVFSLSVGEGGSNVERFRPPSDLSSRARRRLRQWRIDRDFASYKAVRPDYLEPFSDDRTMYGAQVADALPECDVVNLHWIARFVDIRAFFRATSQPIVWTLHDQNAFTGGCHYDRGCTRHTQQCGACPQLCSSKEDDLSRKIWKRKREAYAAARGRLQVVTPSEWLAEAARSSGLMHDIPVTVIPYGLDTEVFAPHGGDGLRSALGLGPDDLAVLFVADSTANQRKGFSLLLDALSRLDAGSNVHLVSVGRSKPEVDATIPHHHLGLLSNDRLLAAVYAAVDVFVIPSLQDNLPNTVLEAMACGTPVVGFDAGGIPDMVRPGETGWLADTGDPASLAATLRTALGDGAERRRCSARCREVVEDEYTLARQARDYQSLYRKITSSSHDDPVKPPASRSPA